MNNHVIAKKIPWGCHQSNQLYRDKCKTFVSYVQGAVHLGWLGYLCTAHAKTWRNEISPQFTNTPCSFVSELYQSLGFRIFLLVYNCLACSSGTSSFPVNIELSLYWVCLTQDKDS